MKLIKKAALALALSSVAMAASAMNAIDDSALGQVSGQDGVSIAASLNVNVGSFTYTDTKDAAGSAASVSFNNIGITGLIGATLDVISATQFAGILKADGLTLGSSFYSGTDVVQIAIPSSAVVSGAAAAAGITVKIGSITMGTNGATPTNSSGTPVPNPSFGSLAMNNINMQGTTAWIWAH